MAIDSVAGTSTGRQLNWQLGGEGKFTGVASIYVMVTSPGLEEAFAGRTATCENCRKDGPAEGTLATCTMEEQSASVRKPFLHATRLMVLLPTAFMLNAVQLTYTSPAPVPRDRS